MSVKIQFYIALTLLSLLCTGCPGGTYKSNLKKVQENNMDFPDLRKEYYNEIHFMISELFVNGYEEMFTLQENAETKVVYEMDINFSVEMFSQSDAESIQYAFDSDISKLDAIHDHYILEREASLQESTVSIKKPLPKTVKYPGYIQVVSGANYSNEAMSTYFTATIQVENEFYVFQMIGKKDNMGYLYDDFMDILSSVTK